MNTRKKNTLVSLASAGAGIMSGVFGALGGVAVMYITAWANPEKGKDALRDNYATSICVMLTISAVSVISYGLQGNIDMNTAFRSAVPAAAGGVIGALLCDKLPVSILRAVFSGICIWAGVRMIMGG